MCVYVSVCVCVCVCVCCVGAADVLPGLLSQWLLCGLSHDLTPCNFLNDFILLQWRTHRSGGRNRDPELGRTLSLSDHIYTYFMLFEWGFGLHSQNWRQTVKTWHFLCRLQQKSSLISAESLAKSRQPLKRTILARDVPCNVFIKS